MDEFCRHLVISLCGAVAKASVFAPQVSRFLITVLTKSFCTKKKQKSNVFALPKKLEIYIIGARPKAELYSVARPKAELRSTGNNYNFFSPPSAIALGPPVYYS